MQLSWAIGNEGIPYDRRSNNGSVSWFLLTIAKSQKYVLFTFYIGRLTIKSIFFARLTFILEQLSQQLERWDKKKYTYLV